MIGYTTIGSNDLEKAKTFFDAVLAPLGVQRGFDLGRIQFYGRPGEGSLAVCKPYDEDKAIETLTLLWARSLGIATDR